MSKHLALLPVPGVTATGMTILEFPSPLDGRLTRVDLFARAANAGGDAVFDIERDAGTLFVDQTLRPRMLSGQVSASRALAAPGFAVIKGEWLKVICDQLPAGGFGRFAFEITFEDDIGTSSTVEYITPVIGAGVTHNGVIRLGLGFVPELVEASALSRLRLYTRADKRAADASRPVGIFPTGAHGCGLDEQLTATHYVSAGLYRLHLQLVPPLFNLEDVRSPDISFALANLTAGAAAITFRVQKLTIEG